MRVYKYFHAYMLFCLWGVAICIVLGGLALTLPYSVLIGLLVLLIGVAALCLLPLFFRWLKKHGPVAEYIVGGVTLLLIAYAMLTIQSHFPPR